MILLLLMQSLFPDTSSLYDFKINSIDGKELKLETFRGKKVLIVNTASECGYTPQYADLEDLYKEYKSQLVIIGVPSNEFGEQEPGTNSQISEFCWKNYKVTFPLTEKTVVKGKEINPLFKWLTTQPNPDFTGDIKWNFEKFLIDENGKLIRRFGYKVSPKDESVVRAILGE